MFIVWKKKKVWFLVLIFLLSFFFSACFLKQDWTNLEDQLQLKAEHIIDLLNQAFISEGKVFSGHISLQEQGKKSTQLEGSGSLGCFREVVEGELGFSIIHHGPQVGSSFYGELQTLLRKEGKQLFLFPKHFIFSQGTGNIQALFIKRLTQELLNHWLLLEIQEAKFPFCFSWIPQIPQLFSGGIFQREAFSGFVSQVFSWTQFLSGTALLDHERWSFQNMRFKNIQGIWFFEGSFDKKSFSWILQRDDDFPLRWKLSYGKDQLFLVWGQGERAFEFLLKFSQASKQELMMTFWKKENKNEKLTLSAEYMIHPKNWALQSLPNSYISIEKYLADLNISF